jgi:hypothetical protein
MALWTMVKDAPTDKYKLHYLALSGSNVHGQQDKDILWWIRI